MRKYQIQNSIGSGNFSVVHKGILMPSHAPCAIKIMKSHHEIALREAMMLKKLKHPNIVALIDFDRQENQSRLILQFLGINTLELYESQPQGLTQQQVKCILFQAALGLHCVHSQGVIHRDIKPENILIDKKKAIVKLVDFGLAIEQRKCQTDYIATRWYRAPQNLLGTKQYTCAIDVFSLGCVIVELYLGSALFPGSHNLDQISKIFSVLGYPTYANWPKGFEKMIQLGIKPNSQKNIKINLKSILNNWDRKLANLIQKMLQLNPKNRITCLEILKHSYFRDIKGIVPPQIYRRYQQDMLRSQSPSFGRGLIFKTLNSVKSHVNFPTFLKFDKKVYPHVREKKQNQKNIESPQFLKLKKSFSLDVDKNRLPRYKPNQQKHPEIVINSAKQTQVPSKFWIHPYMSRKTMPNQQRQDISKNKLQTIKRDHQILKSFNMPEDVKQEKNVQMKDSNMNPNLSQATTVSHISKIFTPNCQVENKNFSAFCQAQNNVHKFFPAVVNSKQASEPLQNQIKSGKATISPCKAALSHKSLPRLKSLFNQQSKNQLLDLHQNKAENSKQEITLNENADIEQSLRDAHKNVQIKNLNLNISDRNLLPLHFFQRQHPPHPSLYLYTPPSLQTNSPRMNIDSRIEKLNKQIKSRAVINHKYRYFGTSPESGLTGRHQRLLTVNSPVEQFMSPTHRKL